MRYLKKRSFNCPFCRLDHDESVDRCPVADETIKSIHKMGGSVLEGKYKIGSMIGTGGMGVVYEGTHKGISRKVAVKFLSPEACGSHEARQRFINEAKIAASLGHMNIVAVHDMGETSDDVPYIVMDYLEGESLSDLLERELALPVERAVDIALQVLDGLHAVHSRGIVHRDLKPGNVFLALQSGGQEIVKLLDFGISRLSVVPTDQESRLTEAGKVYGTPFYISPEQAKGRLDADHRADLYSVGILLYEMTTGKLPFTSISYTSLMVDIITKPPPDPRDYAPELPVNLVAVINRALSKNPSMRFESAQHMAQALEPFRGHDSKPASRKPSKSGTRTRSSTPPKGRESPTGYRVVDSSDSDGPLARARKRKSETPPANHMGIPSPPTSVEIPNQTDGTGRSTAPSSSNRHRRLRASSLAETRPIPRSDPMRETPVVIPDHGSDMREGDRNTSEKASSGAVEKDKAQ